MNNITSEGLSLLLSTGPLSSNTDKKVTVNFSSYGRFTTIAHTTIYITAVMSS